MRTGYLMGGIGVALIIILAIQFWPEASTSDVPDAPVRPESVMPSIATSPATSVQDNLSTAADQAVDLPPAVPLPPLTESDDFVREQLSDWSLPAAWLAREDLVPRLSVVMLNAAQGRLPRRQLGFLAPSGAYPVISEGDAFFTDPAGYARYTPYLDLLEQLPASRAAQLLRQIEPLVIEALTSLGERQSPASLLQEAVAGIQALPELDEAVMLVQPNVMYRYADPALESRSELDKQLLRMGPENVRRLKSYTAQFMQAYQARTD